MWGHGEAYGVAWGWQQQSNVARSGRGGLTQQALNPNSLLLRGDCSSEVAPTTASPAYPQNLLQLLLSLHL